ncbi:MAG: TIGR03905 family TSCPD domain-containing protein [Lachnospiraceae bacterium]|nr:TIGR03905 family TSCPD domain-containing protein [Lachnospiraceae bacterium]
MRYQYITKGTCSKAIQFDINDGVINNVQFIGGCPGNVKAVAKLVEGMTADRIAEILLGNDCAGRGTSCADQLARAVLEAKEAENA